jgi:hypothetical protein
MGKPEAWRIRIYAVLFPSCSRPVFGFSMLIREFSKQRVSARGLTRDLVFWRGKPYSGVYSIETSGTAR